MTISAVAVYLSSSASTPPCYREATVQLAQGIARRGWTLVWGGTTAGLMCALGDAAVEAGARTVAVIPRALVEKGIAYPRASELVATDCMRTRKATMEARADAFVALPGGIGTLEELAEVVTSRQLGFHMKPAVVVNTDGFYDPLIDLLRRMVERRFAKPSLLDLLAVAPDPESALDWLAAFEPRPVESKWL